MGHPGTFLILDSPYGFSLRHLLTPTRPLSAHYSGVGHKEQLCLLNTIPPVQRLSGSYTLLWGSMSILLVQVGGHVAAGSQAGPQISTSQLTSRHSDPLQDPSRQPLQDSRQPLQFYIC